MLCELNTATVLARIQRDRPLGSARLNKGKCSQINPVSAHWDRPEPKLKKCSIHHLLQLLHCQCAHGLGGGLGLEDARLLGEGVHSLASWGRRLLLELQVEAAANFKRAVLLQ